MTSDVTTALAVEAIAWGRAPKCLYTDGRESWVNRRVVCADGFKVSLQASERHYANDSHESGQAAYWRFGDDESPAYPFTTFEVGNPSDALGPADVWDEYDSNGVWAWVPRGVAADLLEAHGGAVGWEEPRRDDNEHGGASRPEQADHE